MENHKDTAFFTIILFAVLILSVINYRNIDVLESRINTIAKYKDTKNELDSNKGFKEDYYITQQSHDTNLTLVVFGILVALSGFFTYKNIDVKFEEKAKDLKNEIEIFKNEWLISKQQLDVLKLESFDLSTRFFKEIADLYLLKDDVSQYLYYGICAASSTVEYILFSKEESNDDEEESFLDNFETYIDSLNENIEYDLEIRESTLKIIEREMTTIRKLENSRINLALSKIHTKLKKIEV